jgi:hypothetical protein
VKRHIKCDDPFEKIVFKNARASKSKSQTKQRSISTKHGKPILKNEKIREAEDAEDSQRYDHSKRGGGDKYD